MKKLFFTLIQLLILSSFAQKTNVVFILVDDLKPLINSYGANQMITPNLDRFAEQGVVFTNAHAQQAVCAASRVSFMTGMRPDYTQVLDLKTHMRDKDPNALTIAEYYKQKGYATIGLGKVLHGAKKNDPQSWSVPFINDDELPYSKDVSLPADLQYQNAHTQETYKSLIKTNTPKGKIKGLLKKAKARPSTEIVDVPDDAYADGAIAVKSIEILEKYQKTNAPFFLTIGFKKPHLPFTPPKKYWDLYDRDDIELAPFQEKAKQSPGYAYHGFGELKNYSDITENLDEQGRVIDPKQKELIHGYYASVSYTDAQLGKVLDFIDNSSLKENTVIVLIGDHGWHLGDHGLWNKHSNFEQATRTPIMVLTPNRNKGIINSSPVELIDAFPTICELSNIKTPGHLQGTSLVPIINNQQSKVKEIAISQYPRHGAKMGYAARSDRYRYVEWKSGDYKKNKDYINGEVQGIELYDYELDPLETKNLANDNAYKDILLELKSELNRIINN